MYYLSHGKSKKAVVSKNEEGGFNFKEDERYWAEVKSSDSLIIYDEKTKELRVDPDQYIMSHNVFSNTELASGDVEVGRDALNNYLFRYVDLKIVMNDEEGCGEILFKATGGFPEPYKMIFNQKLTQYDETTNPMGIFRWSFEASASNKEKLKEISVFTNICKEFMDDYDCLLNGMKGGSSRFQYRDSSLYYVQDHPYLSFFDQIAVGPEIGLIDNLVDDPKVASLFVKASDVNIFNTVQFYVKKVPLQKFNISSNHCTNTPFSLTTEGKLKLVIANVRLTLE